MNSLAGQVARKLESGEPQELGQSWFTAAELAELALPGLARDKRSLNRRAREESWMLRCANS